MTGYPDAPPSDIRDTNDLRGGTNACLATLAALWHVAHGGGGLVVDAATRDALVVLQGHLVLAAEPRRATAAGRQPRWILLRRMTVSGPLTGAGSRSGCAPTTNGRASRPCSADAAGDPGLGRLAAAGGAPRSKSTRSSRRTSAARPAAEVVDRSGSLRCSRRAVGRCE